MNLIDAIILGIVQGITEFLPISSTGHLTLCGKLMNLIDETNPQKWTAFIAIIQLGTLLSITSYFAKDLYFISKDFINENILHRKAFKLQHFNSRLGWLIIIGSIPIFFFGLVLKDFIEGTFTKNLYVISASLIILGLLLAFAEKIGKRQKNIEQITLIDAIVIGLAQAIALIPGSSRSGTTITAALFIGVNRESAARFSFLLSVPAIFASGIYQAYKAIYLVDKDYWIAIIVATVFSAISGFIAIEFLLRYLKKNTTYLFVFYRIILGVVILILLYYNIILP
jgi:undecaprenyl-diphosphatase